MSSVPQYRLYFLDGISHISNAEWLMANGDEDALRIARSRKRQASRELWSGDRFIARIPARGTQPDSLDPASTPAQLQSA